MSRQPRSVVSLQSAVAYGHVGNSAATLPLQRLGFEVWPVATVSLAHHPAHGAWRGRIARKGELDTVLEGLEACGAFADCAAVLSGYLGEAALGPVVLEAVARAKRADPDAVYCCDPVMGDAGGFYVRAGIPAFLRDAALPCADILLPNPFELGVLAGGAIAGIAAAEDAARALLARGPRLVVVTGLERVERGTRRIGALAVARRGSVHVETPWVDAPASGAGDAFAALFLGHVLRGRPARSALELAVSALHAVLVRPPALGSPELALVAAQDEFRAPKRLFKAVKMR